MTLIPVIDHLMLLHHRIQIFKIKNNGFEFKRGFKSIFQRIWFIKNFELIKF